MSAIDQLFQTLRAEGKKAFMPFITAGDPSLDFTSRLLRELSQSGCHLCEVGIPYSDPIADGPVIQASYTRALGHGVKLNDILANVTEVTSGGLSMPVVTMVSYAIVLRHGLEKYVDDAIAAGVSGAIVPDLLTEESACAGLGDCVLVDRFLEVKESPLNCIRMAPFLLQHLRNCQPRVCTVLSGARCAVESWRVLRRECV